MNDAALLQVHQEHAAGFQTPLDGHVGRVHRQDAGFRGHDHPAVPGHRVAAGPQAVPVQHRTHADPVGERNRRRAIPGLHEAGMVGVKIFFGTAHGLVVLPGLGDQHHHALGQRAAGVQQQLQGVVQGG
jgi:hypothetical protein